MKTSNKTDQDHAILKSTKAQLAAKIRNGANDYAEVRRRNPMLAAYATLQAFLLALKPPTDGDWTVRATLTHLMLVEAKRGSQLMYAVLLQAFLPLLGKLMQIEQKRHTVWEPQWPYLLEAFVEAVAAYPAAEGEAKPCRFLRRETERRFIRDMRRLVLDNELIAYVDMEQLDQRLAGVDPAWAGPVPTTRESRRFRLELEKEADSLVELLNEAAGGKLSQESLELVEATVLRGEDLGAYVDRCFPGLTPAARKRTYNRVQQQRYRAMEHLRDLLPTWFEGTKGAATELPQEVAHQGLTQVDP